MRKICKAKILTFVFLENALAKIFRPTNKRAHIIFSPSPEQQKAMSKEGEEGIAGQFVVEYDVENQKSGGEILVSCFVNYKFCIC